MNYSCTQDTAACTGIHPLTTSSAKGYCHVLPGLRSVMHFSEANLPVPPLRAKRFKTVQHQWSILDPMYFEDEWALSHQVLSISQLLLLHTQRESKKAVNFAVLFGCTWVILFMSCLSFKYWIYQLGGTRWHVRFRTQSNWPAQSSRSSCGEHKTCHLLQHWYLNWHLRRFFQKKKTNLYQSKVKRFPNQGV